MTDAHAYLVEPINPFGLLVRANGSGADLRDIAPERIHQWIAEHRFVLFRNFQPLDGARLPVFAATLGEPQRFEFGMVNELIVKDDTKNYLYTNRDVPFHWDGAFIGQIPHYIFFHCITAPPLQSGGETLFCDTIRLVAESTPEDRTQWETMSITYTTEKVVHYGGQFKAQLLGTHPIVDKPVMRFAERVDDINPVALDIEGLPRSEHDRFLEQMSTRLRDPSFCYAHAWQSGDVLIADNHALLHGRRAFLKQAPRHIRRVNLMQPTSRGPVIDFILDNLMIRRIEYFVAEIPILLIPLLVSIPDASFFRTTTFWEGVLIFFLLFNFGDMINCLADRELDRVYKPHLSRAVHRLGVGHVRAQIAVTAVAALALAGHLSYLLDNWLVLPLVAVGLFLGAAYSVEPFRLKRRGVLQVICLWLIIFVGPMMLTSCLGAGFPPAPVMVLASAYATLQMGVILFNTAEDYPEDRQDAVMTTIVTLGLHRGIALAVSMAMLGGVLTLATLVLLYWRRAVPTGAYAVLVFTGVAYTLVAFAMRRVSRGLSHKKLDQAILDVKRAGRWVPVWVTTVAWSSFLAALILFLTARRQP